MRKLTDHERTVIIEALDECLLRIQTLKVAVAFGTEDEIEEALTKVETMKFPDLDV